MKINRQLFWNNINFISILLYPLSLVTFFINILKKTSHKKDHKIKTAYITKHKFSGILQGDMGISDHFYQPVSELIIEIFS